MVTLEQVERMREKANISYEEAKAVLEKTNGDILEAIIILEKEQRIAPPQDGGFYCSKDPDEELKDRHEQDIKGKSEPDDSISFAELARRFVGWCRRLIVRGNRNSFEVKKDGTKIMTVPVTVLVVLLIFTFWVTVPLIIIGLFLGYRYSFAGPDLGKESVNQALDSVAQAAENIKREVKDSNERMRRKDTDN
jgi:hypothetical protein